MSDTNGAGAWLRKMIENCERSNTRTMSALEHPRHSPTSLCHFATLPLLRHRNMRILEGVTHFTLLHSKGVCCKLSCWPHWEGARRIGKSLQLDFCRSKQEGKKQQINVILGSSVNETLQQFQRRRKLRFSNYLNGFSFFPFFFIIGLFRIWYGSNVTKCDSWNDEKLNGNC